MPSMTGLHALVTVFATVLVSMFALAACGEADEAQIDVVPDDPIQQGLTWSGFPSLTALPSTRFYEIFAKGGRLHMEGANRYGVSRSTSYFVDGADVIRIGGGEDHAPISTGIKKIWTQAVFMSSAGKTAYVVAGETAAEKGRLEVYIDSDGDSLVLASDLSLGLTDDSTYAKSTWIAVVSSGDALYVLDGRNLAVRRVTSLNSEGVPSVLVATVFLDSTQTHSPLLEHGKEMEWHAQDSKLGLRGNWGEPHDYVGSTLWVRDTSSDGIADEFVVEPYHSAVGFTGSR